MADSDRGGAAEATWLHGTLRRAVDVKANEVRAMLMSFAYFFFVMSGYFILRPIRDAVAAGSGIAQVPWLFAGTLAGMLVCNPLFSALVARYPARRFVPYTYNFFIANLLGFYLFMRIGGAREGSPVDVWTGRAFFVWASVFNLFVVSVFWSVMADVFRSDQAKRLFGFIGVGGTIGSIVGSSVTAVLAARIGTLNLFLVSAVLLEAAVLIVVRFPAASVTGTGDAGALDRPAMGGSIWAGFTSIARSPYLIGIAVFLVIYVVGSTLLYFEQTDIVGRSFADRASRTAVLAKVEIAAQTLTVLTQVFFTGRVIRWCGLAVTLALQPLLTILGFGLLGMIPTFTVLSVFIVLRRASNFSLTNPAMETLFTVVPREDKYKAKSFIETAVYRGGDQVGAWTIGGLTAIGFGLAQIAFAAVPMAAVWLVLGLWLGRRQAVLAAERA